MEFSNAEQLQQLAETHGTPLWVYDADRIRENVARLRRFDVIRYAQKANANIHLLKLLRGLEVKVDAISGGEIARALAAGFAAGREAGEMVFTADLFDRATLQQVIALDMQANLGSMSMIDQLGAAAPGHAVWLRVNPGFGHGHTRKTNTGGPNSKHGIWYEDLPAALELVRRYRLDLVGLHLHIGSGADDAHLRKACEAMQTIAETVAQPIRAISTGGGLSIPYRSDEPVVDVDRYFDCWNAVRHHIETRQGFAPVLEIEPGRFLVGNAGVLLAEVRATKSSGSNHFTLIDAGMNDLVRPVMYGGYHHISLLPADRQPRSLIETIVGGPLCESGDVFTQGADGVVEPRVLPEPRVGDWLVIHDVGAYGAAMSSNYNSRLLVPEVLLNGDAVQLIRRRQMVEDLLSLERV